ncbi:MAG: biotin transporter BioY [Lachnospiraceae bacterium]|nr:biotin transporter BioY [Lachnospiraceae bacterium]
MKKRSSIYQLTTCALMVALMCVLGPMSIPIGPIPVSFTNLVIYLTVYLLGMKGATISYVVYLLLGAAGLPVFSGYAGGLAKLAGPTGGYLIGFIFMALICGFVMEKFYGNNVVLILGMFAATLVAYLFGTVWFIFEMQCEVWYALTACVFPFIPFDLAKIVIATVLGKIVRHALAKSNLLPAHN